MKVYKDAHTKIFSLHITSKNILENNLLQASLIFQVHSRNFQIFYDMPKITQSRIKDINNINMLFQKVIFGNIINKAIYGIEHPIQYNGK